MTTIMVEVAGVGHTFHTGDGRHTALGDVSFTVAPGELLCVVGPSGCGKSTLLRIIAGLHPPTRGEVLLDGHTVRSVPPGLAVVWQDYSRSLPPWQRAIATIELCLRELPLTAAQRRQRAEEALAEVGLSTVGHRYPGQLSGGMQQRLAIARALAVRPRLLLMDEPFASVDAQTRFELEDLLLAVHAEHDVTIMLVTHDVDEAVYLADRILVLSPGSSTTVVDTLAVDLARPREQITTRESAAFVALRARLARQLLTRPDLTH